MICKRFYFAFLVLVFCGCLKACSAGSARSEYVFGTICRIDLFEYGNTALYERLFARLAGLEKIFSANRADSELAKINQNAGGQKLEISPELFTVLERALYFAEISGGAFDSTVGPLVKLWGIGTETPRIPSDEEIDAALTLVNYRDLELTADSKENSAGTVRLKRPGMALDLGAIVKGYAADELAAILKEEGIPQALIDLGGNIYVWGQKSGGKDWRIGVQDPLASRENYAGIITLAREESSPSRSGGVSAVTSGIYERYFTGYDGNHYHHIMELGTGNRRGYPVENGLLSATIIAASSMDADALSTACFALGYEKGLALAESNKAEALFIFKDKTISGSPRALAAFSAAGNYRVE